MVDAARHSRNHRHRSVPTSRGVASKGKNRQRHELGLHIETSQELMSKRLPTLVVATTLASPVAFPPKLKTV